MSDVRRILTIGRSGRRRLAAAITLGVLASASAVGLAATSAWLIARASEQPPVLHLMVAIVAVRTFGLARGVLRYGERLAGHDASFRLLGDLRASVLTRLERLLPGARGTVPSGDLLTRFVGDVDGLADLWVRVVLPGLTALVVALGTVAGLAAILPAAGVVVGLAMLLAGVASPWVASRRARRSARDGAPLRGEYRAELLETLDGAAELAVVGALESRLARLAHLDERMREADRATAHAAGAGAIVGVLAGGLAVVAALAVAAPEVRGGRLDPVLLAVVVLTPLALHEVVAAFAAVGAELPVVAGRAARVVAVLDDPDPVVDPAAPAPAPVGPLGLRVRGLVLGWEGGPAVVDGLDLDIPAGAVVALLGPSGSGKSTVAMALLRFVEPRAGSIELVGTDDGVVAELGTMSGDDVRARIGWCAQDAHVFDSTVRANLLLAAPDAADGALVEALARVRLDRWLAELPDGLDTMVGEHGRTLSGGERQRLSLARVLLAAPPIVVLDEPTEHVDDETAAALLDDLLDASRGRTTLLLSHRRDLLAGRPGVRVEELAPRAQRHAARA